MFFNSKKDREITNNYNQQTIMIIQETRLRNNEPERKRRRERKRERERERERNKHNFTGVL